MSQSKWESPYELYAESEFCWNCAELLDEETTITVSANTPHRIWASQRSCCSETCASRAVVRSNEPTRTVAQVRHEMGLA